MTRQVLTGILIVVASIVVPAVILGALALYDKAKGWTRDRIQPPPGYDD